MLCIFIRNALKPGFGSINKLITLIVGTMKSKLSKYKQCKCCLLYKERNMFYKSSDNKDGLVSYCKPCAASKIKKWKKSEKFHKWNQAYKLKNYGINTESYQNLLKLQNGKCAICKLARYRGKDTTLHIDH